MRLPRLSTKARILQVIPPRDLPIDCLKVPLNVEIPDFISGIKMMVGIIFAFVLSILSLGLCKYNELNKG